MERRELKLLRSGRATCRLLRLKGDHWDSSLILTESNINKKKKRRKREKERK